MMVFLTMTVAACLQTDLSHLQGSLRNVAGSSGQETELSESTVIAGLKEALEVGTNNAVKMVSQAGGYLHNPKIRIPLPEPVQDASDVLRKAGMGKQLDQFERSMNRAAEKAAPKAKAIFWDAIKEMTFSDARKLLHGSDNAVTLYFKEKTYAQLSASFDPIIHEAMASVGVTHWFQRLNETLRMIPFTESFRLDLDQYVNEKALEGLFTMLAIEEKKIRQDPAARVTTLLQHVFR